MNKEQITNARNASLVDYFERNGYKTQRHGGEVYVKEIPGLCINEERNSWYNHYTSVGGNNSVNCLTDIMGLAFKDAVNELASEVVSVNPPQYFQRYDKEIKKNENVELKMPEKNGDEKKVFAYFSQTRKIPAVIISNLIKSGLLYQDTRGNAVFVRKDTDGNVGGGEVHGTNSYKRYKQEIDGKCKAFSFKVGENPDKVFVFESAIDLISFYTIYGKQRLENSILVSMGGLKPSVLTDFKNQNMKIYGCVDNQKEAKDFCVRNDIEAYMNPLERQGVKDWNDLVVKVVNSRERQANSQEQTQKASQKIEADTENQTQNYASVRRA